MEPPIYRPSDFSADVIIILPNMPIISQATLLIVNKYFPVRQLFLS